MGSNIRVLGIAPYEGMKNLMAAIATEYPQIELTLFVGDLTEGVEIAKSNFHGNFDVVISRGMTAHMIQQLSLPVIEVELSVEDILYALKLAQGMTGKSAIVSLADLADNARLICDLLGYDVDIYIVRSSEVRDTLQSCKEKDYQAIICDQFADATAKQLGINSFLITSGANSIRLAFKQAVLLCKNQSRLQNENYFFRELIDNQIGETVVFDKSGVLFLSTTGNTFPEALDILRREFQESLQTADRRITRVLKGMIYSIRSRRVQSGDLVFVAFFFTRRKVPLSSNQTGITFSSRAEAEKSLYENIFCYSGLMNRYWPEIVRIGGVTAPVMISGEDGMGKATIARALYVNSLLRNNPFVAINCSLLNDRSWAFLMDHHASPLLGEGNTIYFSSVDALSDQDLQKLLAALSEMDICRRNRVFFSCICQPGEYMSAAGSLFADKLSCLSLYIAPLRESKKDIPSFINLSLSHMSSDLPHQVSGTDDCAIQLLQNFPWPRNLTQFDRVIRELATTARGATISEDEVRQALKKERHVGSFQHMAEDASSPLDLNRPLFSINQDVARRVLMEEKGNHTAAAKRLGISRTTLWRLLQNS